MIARRTITLNDRTFGATLDNTGMGLHNGSYDLTIILRIRLVENGDMNINPGSCEYYADHSPSQDELLLERVVGMHPDYDGRIFMLENWDQREWRGFCDFFANESTAFWTNRFTLSSSHAITVGDQERTDSYWASGFDRRHSQPPVTTINCKFLLELTTNPAFAHKTISVYKVSQLETTSVFRSDDAHYTSGDLESQYRTIVDPNPALCGQFSSQRTFIHEVGHAIGLPHVGISARIPGCTQNDNGTKICYGNTLETSLNVMGRGEELSWREALPWRTAIAEMTHTSPDSWHVQNTPHLQVAIGDITIY
ncbi:MAG: hypothetical protein IPI22_13470 [Bacteroidetes bacterium]|nr:hypothetical protein [Bacteroidota bacterium]